MTGTVHVDKAIAKRILGGDEEAFRELFDRFFPRLYRFAAARLKGDSDAAADVVQETFCKAIEKLDTYRGEAALYTWFAQICRNTIIDFYRASERTTNNLVLIEDYENIRWILDSLTAPVQDQPETNAGQRDVRRLVQATLDLLPGRYGDVLEWKYVDGCSVKEIAAKLDLSAKAAESLLTRARNSFREVIGNIAEEADVLQFSESG